MGRTLDGYLILGWEVEKCEAKSMYDEDGDYIGDWEDNEEVAAKIESIFSSVSMEASWKSGPTWQYSLYYDCDEMWVGIRIGKNGAEGIREFAQRILDNADKYEQAAYAIYEAIMGRKADTPPCVMEIECEG